MAKIPRSFATHDGSFHADEVSACALLLLFNLIDRDKIVRTREHDLIETCEFICDVGGHYLPAEKRFDHHQVDYTGPLSSAGMVLLFLKDVGILTTHEYDLFNNHLIMGVDAHDNGRDPHVHGLCSYSNIISSFTPLVNDSPPEQFDQAFFEALDFAVKHLERMRNRYLYAQSLKQLVKEAMSVGTVSLLFDRSMPWQDAFFELGGLTHTALFVIMPAGKHWKLRGIPPNSEDKMKVRWPLPFEWAGLSEDELRRISGIPGAIFCHKGRFISVWETKEDALKALDYVLKSRGE